MAFSSSGVMFWSVDRHMVLLLASYLVLFLSNVSLPHILSYKFLLLLFLFLLNSSLSYQPLLMFSFLSSNVSLRLSLSSELHFGLLVFLFLLLSSSC